MRKNSERLLAGAALAVLAIGAGPAAAFENGAWSWSSTVTESNSTNAETSLQALPSGRLTADGIQVLVGNSAADAHLSAQVTPPSDPLNPQPSSALTDLGTITGSSGAYGNVIAVDAAVPISARIGQYHVGGYDATVADPTAPDLTLVADINPHHVMMNEMRDQAEAGLLLPHQTASMSEAVGIANVMVDLESRAVSNSVGYELTASPAQPLEAGVVVNADGSYSYPLATDTVLTADTTQFSLGQTSATGNVSQTMDNFTDLAAVGRPLSSVTATAIGNLGTSSVNFAAQ